MTQKTVIEQIRKGSAVNPQFKSNTDICPKCKCSFKKCPFKIVFKDVVECSECGHVTVVDYETLVRFSDGSARG